MIYKNITALALAILLTLSIVSCGGCNANENKTENSSQNTLGPSTDSVKQMKDEDLGYGADIFDRAVISIDITATAEDWQYLMDNATEKPWITCSVEFNGETFENVGLKTKGNSSLSQVASMRDSDRYSLKLKFDKYVDDQRYHGLDEVALNNIFKDATYLKEYMSYDLYRFMGVPCSYCTFAEITVNGQFYGFFIVVEEVDDSFLERNYGDSHSVEAYKPDSDEMMGGSGSSSGGIDLVYYGDDASRYSAIFDNAITKTSDTDAARLISSLKAIDEGNIEEYINVDEVLRFTACSVFLVHLDSYLSSMEHNYILIEDGGVLSMLPWDLNESFGTHKLNNASDAINYDIDSIFYGVSAEQRPIISKLLEKEEYAEKYRGYLKQIAEEYVGSGLFEQKVNTICGAIDAYVKNDSTSFNGYEAFDIGATALKLFGTLRAEAVLGQLSGLNTHVDASKLNLSALSGSTSGGGGNAPRPPSGGGRPGRP